MRKTWSTDFVLALLIFHSKKFDVENNVWIPVHFSMNTGIKLYKHCKVISSADVAYIEKESSSIVWNGEVWWFKR